MGTIGLYVILLVIAVSLIMFLVSLFKGNGRD
jgi:hypothetical protein